MKMTPCRLSDSQTLDKRGYPRVYDSKRYRAGKPAMVPAYWLAWEEAFGPLPKGMQIHHLCENRLCVNVDHLVALTPQQHNALHAQSKQRSVCSKGHPLTGKNRKLNGFTKSGTPKYTCRTCANDRLRARYEPKQTELAQKRRAAKERRAG